MEARLYSDLFDNLSLTLGVHISQSVTLHRFYPKMMLKCMMFVIRWFENMYFR